MADDDRDVLSSLPRSRPQRRSAKRDGTRRGGAKAAAAGAEAPTKPKAKPRAKPKSAAKAGKPAPKAKPKAPVSTPPPAAGYATEARTGRGEEPDALTTAVQAAGELAQIGLAAGGQALKGLLSRLPKP